jgi:hypothetical protein
MKNRGKLIIWDIALLAGVLLFLFWNIRESSKLIVGFMSVLVLSTCVRNHIAAYKLTGKIY